MLDRDGPDKQGQAVKTLNAIIHSSGLKNCLHPPVWAIRVRVVGVTGWRLLDRSRHRGQPGWSVRPGSCRGECMKWAMCSRTPLRDTPFSEAMTVHPMPHSQFAMPAVACADVAIAFQNRSASTWQVRLEVTAPNGCTDDTLRLVTPDFFKGLYIPNAFSPEQGIGDVRLFRPRGAGLKEYRIEVYSPWGQLLWWSDKLENGQPAEAWDGRLEGKLLPQDVYVWKAFGIFEDGTVWRGMPDGKGGFKTMGTVVLLR